MKATQTELDGVLTPAERFICHSPAAQGARGKTEIFLGAVEGRSCGCSAAREGISVCLIWGRSQFALHRRLQAQELWLPSLLWPGRAEC